MHRSPFSSAWYRVAGLRPRLREHARIHRQRMRGATWYVLQDVHSGRFHRMSPAAHLAVCLLDGRRTVREVWETVGQKLAAEQPSQDEMIRLLVQLHAADLLTGEFPPDPMELNKRADSHARRSLLLQLRNPLALRFPLLDPDRFLDLTLPLVRWLFSAAGCVLWLLLVVVGLIVAAASWPSLSSDLVGRMFTIENVVLIALVYPAIKAMHELGHGYAIKAWGGEVHELGVMLLVLLPVPYVDASAATGFQDKWQRALVAGAGIMVELALAALAVIVWALVEPGLIGALALNVALICSLSTLIVNGNPLMRFDGYYVLADLLEISNLASRSNRYLVHLVQRYGLGLRDSVSPVTANGEAFWFVTYAIASFLYRMLVMVGLAVFVGTQLFFVGVLLAAWALAQTLLLPVIQGVRFVLTNPRLRQRRRRAIILTAAAFAAPATLLFALPLPYATVAEGVVWMPDRAAVRASSEGWLRTIAASPGEQVAAGRTLVELENPLLAGRAAVLESRLAELRARLDAVPFDDQVQAGIFREQLRHTEATAAQVRERLNGLQVRAKHAGQLIVPRAGDLPGRLIQRGELLGYVVDRSNPVIRVVVPQSEADLVRRRTEGIGVRFGHRPELTVPAVLLRELPAASNELPSAALAAAGGGSIPTERTENGRGRALDRYFQFDLAVPGAAAVELYGSRVHARFDHGREPVGWQLLRQLRQVFLSQFRV